MDKKISFNIDKFNIIDEYSDSQLAVVEVYVCHDGNNLHDMPIDLSVIKAAKKTLKNKFLVAGYNGIDFEGHEPDEQIVGFFPESSIMKFEKKDGRTYLVAQAIMSKVYAKWAYDIFVNDDNKKGVSMEITVLDTEVQEDSLEHITKFVFNGVTLLGDNHTPACEGANASIIKFSKENALKFYSKRLKESDKIKKNFMTDIKLAESLGKEESEKMEEKEKDITEVKSAVEEEKEEEVVETTEENFEKKEKESDESTYMEEDEEKEDEKDDDKEEKEEEDKEEEEEEKKENKDFESLTSAQKYEVFRSAVKESLDNCGYLENYDDEYLYVYDYCDGYTYRYAYTLEGTKCTVDLESKTRVMHGGYVEFETYKTTEEKMETLEKTNCELMEKVKAYEIAEKDKAVEAIISDVIDVIPAERIAELRSKSVEYSLENISMFENEVKAAAFEAVATKVKGNKFSFTRLPIDEESIVNKTSKYGW